LIASCSASAGDLSIDAVWEDSLTSIYLRILLRFRDTSSSRVAGGGPWGSCYQVGGRECWSNWERS
jgi:hypothetical protein